jgi:5-formyltetrahydrofolate cyclo-ligase
MEAAFAAGKKVFAPRIEFQDKKGGPARGDLAFHRIFPPGTDGAAWREGPFGIREPLPRPETRLKEGDFPALILAPGLAFDPRGGRLGRGGGCYDRFFAALDRGKISARPEGSAAALPYSALGFCVDFQLVPRVPMEAWDKRMDAVFGG